MPNPLRFIRSVFIIPCFLIYRCSASRNVLDQDIARWREKVGIQKDGPQAFFALMRMSEFRSLLCYRIPACKIFSWLAGPRARALYIVTKGIGPGLYLQHGFATIIHARSIGRNCSINQQVTIGFNGADKFPVIKDNVSVRAGAKVFGEITIGDNVTIGANAVVTKNVPENCVVVGVPAYIIRRDGIAVREELV